MKYPKHRTTVYIVMRQGNTPIAVFASYEEADNFKDACVQEFVDRGFSYPEFDVQVSTFYEA